MTTQYARLDVHGMNLKKHRKTTHGVRNVITQDGSYKSNIMFLFN